MADSSIQSLAQWILCAFPFEPNASPPTLPRANDWDVLLRVAEENAVAPLLYAAIKKLGRANDLPAHIVERLRIHYLRADTANWIALKELQELCVQFERAQIPTAVLKGGALATTLYPELALRPMSDLDLLIPRAQFAAADACMRERGYASPIELRDDYAPRLTNYRAYERHAAGKPAHVELHWHLFKSPYYWQRVPIEWFWDHTTEAMIQDQPLRVLGLEAQLLHLAAHFALHHRAERLIWSYDLARLLARDRERLNWDAWLDAVERFGLALAARSALTQVAQTWGVRAPDAVTARLNLSRPEWRDRAAFALITAQRDSARFLLDTVSQPGLSARAQFLWCHLFPSPAYLRERYRVRTARQLPFFYAWRFVDGVLKLFRSLGSMAMRKQ